MTIPGPTIPLKKLTTHILNACGNNESYIHEEGFEAAYEAREAEILDEEIATVAVLGGHYD